MRLQWLARETPTVFTCILLIWIVFSWWPENLTPLPAPVITNNPPQANNQIPPQANGQIPPQANGQIPPQANDQTPPKKTPPIFNWEGMSLANTVIRQPLLKVDGNFYCGRIIIENQIEGDRSFLAKLPSAVLPYEQSYAYLELSKELDLKDIKFNHMIDFVGVYIMNRHYLTVIGQDRIAPVFLVLEISNTHKQCGPEPPQSLIQPPPVYRTPEPTITCQGFTGNLRNLTGEAYANARECATAEYLRRKHPR